jgi:hypothetical protein
MIKVKSEVKTCVEKYSSQEEEIITVESHNNIDSLVGLYIGGRMVYVDARELKAAIDNATNTARF